jgi:hypothetical protein
MVADSAKPDPKERISMPDSHEAQVPLTLTPNEAKAVWAWLNQYYPESREAFGSACDKIASAMERAGLETEFESEPEGD